LDNIQIPESVNESTSVKLINDDMKNDQRQNTLADTLRRTNSDRSFPSSSTRCFIVREEDSIGKRRSTIDNSSYSFNQNVSTSIYQQVPVNDQNNIQLDMSTEDNIHLELTAQKSGVSIDFFISNSFRLCLYPIVYQNQPY